MCSGVDLKPFSSRNIGLTVKDFIKKSFITTFSFFSSECLQSVIYSPSNKQTHRFQVRFSIQTSNITSTRTHTHTHTLMVSQRTINFNLLAARITALNLALFFFICLVQIIFSFGFGTECAGSTTPYIKVDIDSLLSIHQYTFFPTPIWIFQYLIPCVPIAYCE